MKTILLSTSTGWNAGDDWIREGLLNVLGLRGDVCLLYWNRGYGIEDSYANSLNVNLPLSDYVIMAGTPEWIDKNEALYRHCLHHGKPMALLGVGKTGGYVPSRHEDLMRRVAESGLVEVAIARDHIAQGLLKDFGFQAQILCDPAVFLHRREEFGAGTQFMLGYRGWGSIPGGTVPYKLRATGPARRTDILLGDEWAAAAGPKKIVVHDNREAEAAISLFGRRNVILESDPWRLLSHYGEVSSYVGCRIHGFVAALLHGASAHLIYHTSKAVCAEVIIQRLGLEASARVSYLVKDTKPVVRGGLTRPAAPIVRKALERERKVFSGICRKAPILGEMMKKVGA